MTASALEQFYLQEMLSDDDAPEPLCILLLHLFKAFKEGHLCIKIEEGAVTPSVSSLWDDEEEGYDEKLLEKNIVEGFSILPDYLEKKQVLRDTLFYNRPSLHFKKCKRVEEQFLDEIKRLSSVEHTPQEFSYALGQTKKTFPLNEKQELALTSSQSSAITILAGGPGTGKTFTAAALLYFFAKYKEPVPLKIAAFAPTGKASKHLHDVICHCLPQTARVCLESSTIHKALYSLASEETFSFDLILVDECSMLDAAVFLRLLKAIKAGTFLILLGDQNQLPAVESGSFFADLIYSSSRGNMPINIHLLEKTLRTENQQILSLASSCLQSDAKAVSTHPFVQLIDERENRKTLYSLVQEAKELFSFLLADTFSEKLFSSLSSVAILSATKKSLLGVESINKWVELAITEGVENYFLPIMINENDKYTGLCNGEVLLLEVKQGSLVQAYGQSSCGVETYPPALLPAYSRAFCLSVHKAQGSEYDKVIALFPSHAERFGKELLYTAITRAKKQVRIVANKQALFSSIAKTTRRCSGIE